MIKETIKNITITIDGTWYEITNSLTKNIEDCGSCEIETEQEAKTILNAFIENHTIKDAEYNKVVKRVTYNSITDDFEQLQAVKLYNLDTFIIQRFNSDLMFITELETGYKYEWEVLEHCKNKDIVKGLRCDILTNKSMGDCTNNGISSKHDNLILISENIPKISEAEDITQCVKLDFYKNYVRCKPIILKNKWYMNGGNFLYSCDSRFREISQYPIPIHDRIE
ncbi:hypothetical protein ACYJ2U_001807 [Clostridium botulinum]